MKKIFYLFYFLPFITLGQWIQVGGDIYGENPGDGDGPSYVKINSQGDRLVIGVPLSGDVTTNAGQVRVFELDNNEWIQMGVDLHGNGYVNERFGTSVAISDDGNKIAIGTLENGVGEGNARILSYNGTNWQTLGQILDGDSTGDDFGTSVSLNGSGAIMAVSAPGNDDNGTSAGSVRILENNNGAWMQLGQDILGNPDDEIGFSTSLNNEGTIVAIGSPMAQTVNGFSSGKVSVYRYENDDWIQIGEHIIGNSEIDWSGYSIDLNFDGSRLAIGSIYDDSTNNNNYGSVKVFEYNGNYWEQMGDDIFGEAELDFFGFSVGLNDAGNLLVVGSPRYNNSFLGNTKLFRYLGGSWIQVGTTIEGDQENDYFGNSVSINGEGKIIAITAPGSELNGPETGTVKVFDAGLILGIQDFIPNSIIVYPNPACESINIETESSILKVTIFDIIGNEQPIKSYRLNPSTIDISDLSAGVYLMEIELHDQTQTVKFIKT
jgi:Secretion system C-terminal sorting domain/FG-GAP repeat